MKVAVLGGYGIFGGRVARLLAEDGHQVLVIGRDQMNAAAHAKQIGAVPLALDARASGALQQMFTTHRPDVLIDAIGPFQSYRTDPYAVARAALEAGCHYLDLSDDADFTAGITEFDALANAQGKVALSGVSSIPAISAAVAADLSRDLPDLHLIEAAILPGNRTPRGRSVMAAILSQAGRPLRQWRGGEWITTCAWGPSVTEVLAPGLARPATEIGAPDLRLFPQRFGARSVVFRAGLELKVMHYGLRVLAILHRVGLLPRLDRLTDPLQWVAQRLEPFGTTRGGMVVRAAGRDAQGQARRLEWAVTVDQGDGPMIPAIPSRIVMDKLAHGALPPGARPALDAFTLEEAEAALAKLSTQFHRRDAAQPALFEAALGDAWLAMPLEWRAAHDLMDRHRMTGEASVTRGTSLLSRIISGLFRFPKAAARVPVEVVMQRQGKAEVWTRRFGTSCFRSRLTPAGDGYVNEAFGPFTFELALPVKDQTMQMTVRRGWCLGVPIPRALLPRSDTSEYVPDGRFHFDVRLSAPVAGLLVHYKGWLVLAANPTPDMPRT